MQGKLYIVATPIGNLEDITLRALKVLKAVDIIAAEDTRHTLKLLNHFEISKKLISYYKQNEKSKSDVIIAELLAGKDVAVVSDAGTPGISDPGEEVIKLAIENNIEIIPIPGCVAFVNALIASGMSTKEFCFQGFLETNKKNKKEKLSSLIYETRTIILYEAPHKMKTTLQDIFDILGDRNIVLARELTKIHEEFIRDKISNILQSNQEFKGEFVIIIEGSKISKQEKDTKELTSLTLEEHYNYYNEQGLDKKEIIKKVAKDRNVNKNEIYKHFLNKE